MLKSLSDLSIKRKLPAIIVGFAMLASSVFAVAGYMMARSSLLDSAEERLSSVAESRAVRFETWLDSIAIDLHSLASSPSLHTGMQLFSRGWDFEGGDPSTTLRDAYLFNSPHPVGERDLLDDSGRGKIYDRGHAQFHPWLRGHLRAKGYYDLFLFDMNGNLIYSVFKEPDFGTNFQDGPYASSGLGEAYRAALDLEPDQYYFSDFEAYAASDGAAASFIAKPVVDRSGNMMGVIAFQMSVNTLNTIMQDERGLGETGLAYLVGEDGFARSASSRQPEIQFLETQISSAPFLAALEGVEKAWLNQEDIVGDTIAAVPRKTSFGGVDWILMVEQDMSELVRPANEMGLSFLMGFAVMSGFIVAGGVLVARGIANPLDGLTRAMGAVADGQYDTEITGLGRADEIGTMASRLQDFAVKLKEGRAEEQAKATKHAEQKQVMLEVSDALTKLANGDLTTRIDHSFPTEFEALRSDLNRALSVLDEAVGDVVWEAERIDSQSHRLEHSGSQMNQQSEKQAAIVAENTTAVTEITESVSLTAMRSRECAEATAQTAESAEKSSELMAQSIQAMEEMKTATNGINTVLGLIEDITLQTNLLALNAGVEAARAGESGKGFAVVATEVRALAQRSTDAAADIRALIEKSTASVESGANLVNQTGEVMGAVRQHVQLLNSSIEDISKASQQQASALGEIAEGMTQLDLAAKQGSEIAGDMHSICETLSSGAEGLNGAVKKFRSSRRTENQNNRVA